VVAAAEKEPARFGRVVEEMDATGKVDPAYRQVTEPQKGDQERPDKQELRIYVEDASIPARTLMIDAEGRVGAAHSPDVGIQEGPELEQANTLADVPPGHWNDWLTRHHGPKRGAGLKHDGRFLLDNLKVIEAAPPFSRMSLGCGTFEEVLDYFDLTTEQWEWLKAGEGILFPLGAAPCGDHAG
jgi:hypothetical protein